MEMSHVDKGWGPPARRREPPARGTGEGGPSRGVPQDGESTSSLRLDLPVGSGEGNDVREIRKER
eukprot:13957111-Alexandrium_andersonii.AAC.1